jgi:ABC-2 type transport system permease protein
VPPLLIGALTFHLVMPETPWPYLIGVVSVLFGVGISFGCRFIVNLTAFWLLDIRGATTVYMTISNVLCGLFVPVAWFPGWLSVLAHATPFPSMVQTPADIITGRIDGAHSLARLGVQFGWLVGVLLFGRLLLRWATRRLVIQGG